MDGAQADGIGELLCGEGFREVRGESVDDRHDAGREDRLARPMP